jgi:hypothetical protein
MNETLNTDCVELVELVLNHWTTLAQEGQKLCEDKAKAAGLESALRLCHMLNVTTGFVKDDLQWSKRYLFKNPQSPFPALIGQHNFRRKDRSKGAGRVQPPPGIRPVNGNCPFCNYQWQQFGTEIGYRYTVANEDLIALPNAFPFGELHFTHAAAVHRPQAWHSPGRDATVANLHQRIVCAVEHAALTPERVIFVNDESAGASITAHFHLQSLLRPDGYGYWPLEIAATQTRGQAATAEALLVGAYPIAAVYWCGAKERVFRLACNWIERWLDASGWKPTLRLHIIASARIDDPECIQLFIVPRDSRYPNSQRMVGTVGSLEVLGEFVFCTDDELKMLMNGQINHTTAVEILASVEPRGQREVLARICP